MMTDEEAYVAFLEEIEPDYKTWYIHKHQIAQQYGGPEEGGWWYDSGIPAEDWIPSAHAFNDEEEAYAMCRSLNEFERIRAANEETYEYTSAALLVGGYAEHYSYTVEGHPNPYSYPEYRPHYE